MNIEKLKGFLKEWKEDRVKNGDCQMYHRTKGNNCNSCFYSSIALEVEDVYEDTEQHSICDLLEVIEDTLESEDEMEGLYTREGMYGSDY